jgi:hypothetical protein
VTNGYFWCPLSAPSTVVYLDYLDLKDGSPSRIGVGYSENRLITLTTEPAIRFAVTNPYLVFCSNFMSSEILTSRGQYAFPGFSSLV